MPTQRPDQAPSARRVRRRSARVLAGVGLVAASVSPSLLAPEASAAPTDVVQLAYDRITGATIGRGGESGVVSARMTNTSSIPATGATARYQLPAGVEFIAAGSSAGCVEDALVVSCNVGTLAPGARATVRIGVAEPDATATLGTRAGFFLPPVSDEFDAVAGEVLLSQWNYEMGAEGTDLRSCWPVGNGSPNMDIAGGVCDGTNDNPLLDPDSLTLSANFPTPYAERVSHSWQFVTQVSPPESGSYIACSIGADDGAYLALSPVGTPFDDSSVVLSSFVYDAAPVESAPFTLTKGTRYQVLIRVSNRGPAGSNNGGQNPGGWEAFGLAPAGESCDATDVAVFGTSSIWNPRSAADVVITGTTDLEIAGAIESTTASGGHQTSVRIANSGNDTSSAIVDLEVPADGRIADASTGCIIAGNARSARCGSGPLRPGADGTMSVDFDGPTLGAAWSVTPDGAIDSNPKNNSVPHS